MPRPISAACIMPLAISDAATITHSASTKPLHASPPLSMKRQKVSVPQFTLTSLSGQRFLSLSGQRFLSLSGQRFLSPSQNSLDSFASKRNRLASPVSSGTNICSYSTSTTTPSISERFKNVRPPSEETILLTDASVKVFHDLYSWNYLIFNHCFNIVYIFTVSEELFLIFSLFLFVVLYS